jgi:hypothetical protein
VRERALIHVAGPKRAGKTTFIERVLDGAGEWILAARCVRDDSLRESRETAPKGHPELRRYRAAGATGAALFAFPEGDIGSDAFFVTRLMEDYSKAVLLEGDRPVGFVDLAVFVAAPPLQERRSWFDASGIGPRRSARKPTRWSACFGSLTAPVSFSAR